MAAIPLAPAATRRAPSRWLQAAGACGTMLALAILGASVLLRLTTVLAADGHAISTLFPAMESAIRMIHRLAASGVGLLAISVVWLGWKRGPLPSPQLKAIVLICLATVLLAAIGPLTTGYRLPSVTVGNVAGGVVLLMAFWWLRESAATEGSIRTRADSPLLPAAICVFLAHVAMGAAASAHEMHGVRGFALMHLGTAMVATMFLAATAWTYRSRPRQSPWPDALACLLIAQLVIGFTLMALGSRPVPLGFVHAMLSPMLGITLVSTAARATPVVRTPVGNACNDA